MTKDIQFPDNIIKSNCKSKNSLSIINQLELESFKKKDLIKNKLPILLTLINNFPKKYSNYFSLPENNEKYLVLLKKQAHKIIKRKITVLTSKYRLLTTKRKKNKDVINLITIKKQNYNNIRELIVKNLIKNLKI